MRIQYVDPLQPFCGHEAENNYHFTIIIVVFYLPREKGILSCFDSGRGPGWRRRMNAYCQLVFSIILYVESYFVFLPPQYRAFWSHVYPRVSLLFWIDCSSLSWQSSSGIFQAPAFSISHVYSIPYAFLLPEICRALFIGAFSFMVASAFLFCIFILWKVHRLMLVLSWSIWLFLL